MANLLQLEIALLFWIGVGVGTLADVDTVAELELRVMEAVSRIPTQYA
jgi:hypothetical protein